MNKLKLTIMEKRSKALLIVLREKLNQDKLKFVYDSTLEYQERMYGVLDAQHKSRSLLLRAYKNWEEYVSEELSEDIKPHIKFLHEFSENKSLFNSHHKKVLQLISEVKEQNNKFLKSIGIEDAFYYLNEALQFWDILKDCDWDVKKIDVSHISLDFRSDFGGKGDFFNEIFNLLFRSLDKTISLNSFIDKYKNEVEIPLFHLISPNDKNKRYYKNILQKNIRTLYHYGFLIDKKNDEYQPTIFLRILKDIKKKSFSPLMEFNVLFEDLDGIVKNYCEIEQENDFSEARNKIEMYFKVIIESNKGFIPPSEFKTVHKLAYNKSGIRLLR